MQEFLAHISDTTVSWGAFKIVTGKPGCDNVIIKNPEFIVLKWTSNHKTPLTVSIKSSVQKVDFDVKQTLGVQNQFDALSLDDFNEEVIKHRYRRVYGDHEPVEYEFNNFSI